MTAIALAADAHQHPPLDEVARRREAQRHERIVRDRDRLMRLLGQVQDLHQRWGQTPISDQDPGALWEQLDAILEQVDP